MSSKQSVQPEVEPVVTVDQAKHLCKKRLWKQSKCRLLTLYMRAVMIGFSW
jgi:hypothetical protein